MLRAVLILLAMPIAAGVGLSLLAGARRWRHVAAFFLGWVLYATIDSYLTIFVFRHPKGVLSVDELNLATGDVFELGQALVEVASVVTALALAVGFLFAERVLKSDVGRRHWTHSLFAGALTAFLAFHLLARMGAVCFLLGLAVLPFAYAAAWFRKPGKVPTESDQGAA